jgi:putative oxidoreductase
MTWQLYNWAQLIGRILFSLIFILSGIRHLTQTKAMTGYAAAKRVPAPAAAVVVSGVMLLLGGLSILLGWHRFIGAGLLFIFLVLAAFLVHNPWRETDPMARANEQAHFFKDLALAGAALLIAFYSGSVWPMSIGH